MRGLRLATLLVALVLKSLAAVPTLAQTGTLSGRVTDAADMTLGVSPVDIDLLDPSTGETLGYFARTDANGDYEITGIDPGDYKIFFNAFDTAWNYRDELYDETPCDDGGCDRASLGKTITIAEGSNTWNEALTLVADRPPPGSLAGRVVDAADQMRGLESVAVTLVDVATGNATSRSSTTDAVGSYFIYDIPTGDYKVLFDATGASSEYRDELYDEVPCADGGCDRASLGDVVTIVAGENFLDEELALPAPEGMSREQLAAVLVLLGRSSIPTEVTLPPLAGARPVLDFSPSGNVVAASSFDDGTQLVALGEKAEDGTIVGLSSITVRPAGEGIAAVRADVDDLGRPTRIRSMLGESVFTYGASQMTIVTTNAAGEAETYTAPYTPPQQVAPQDAQACDIDSLFTERLARGELVFACDNAYIEDTTRNAPNSLSMWLYEESGIPLSSGNLVLNSTLPGNVPSRSRHSYEYTLWTNLYGNPTYPEWEACCRKASDETTRQLNALEQTLETVGEIEEIVDYASCGFELVSTGGSVAPTCLRLVQSYFIGLFVEEVVTRLECGEDDYQRSIERFSTDEAYRTATVEVEKTGIRGGRAVYRKVGVDMSGANASRLPTLTVGPVPADFEENSAIESIRAYRSDGSAIAQSGGRLVESGPGTQEPAVIPTDSVLDFRAFDQFFDRSVTNPFTEANREANQHYSCAAYRWTLKRDGDTVQTYSHGDNSDRFQTQALTLGDYELTLDVDSNTTNVGGSFSRTFVEDAKPAGSSISPASAALSFRVGTDDDIIRDHMVGTWDISTDGIFTIESGFADGTGDACTYRYADGVFFTNHFFPDGVTGNIWASKPARKKFRIRLNPDGTGEFLFYNIDTDAESDWTVNCPTKLDPPENAQSIGWVVSDGVFQLTRTGVCCTVKGYLTLDRLKDSYGLNDFDFAVPTRTTGAVQRWRLDRVN